VANLDDVPGLAPDFAEDTERIRVFDGAGKHLGYLYATPAGVLLDAFQVRETAPIPVEERTSPGGEVGT
jgi:hypothetical protein